MGTLTRRATRLLTAKATRRATRKLTDVDDDVSYDAAVTLYAHSKVDLTSPLSTWLGSKPAGNGVKLVSVSARHKLKVTRGARYVPGTNVFAGPDAGWQAAPTEAYTTGFPGSDPAHVDGKGTLALLTPWRQRFTGNLMIPVLATFPSGGVQKVRGYAAGRTLDVSAAKVYTYTDRRGRQKWLHQVYVFELDATLYTAFGADATRGVRLAFESFPNDATFENRVIGLSANAWEHLIFFPASQPHDYLVTVDTSQPVGENGANPVWSSGIAAANFWDVSDAIAYCGGINRTVSVGAGGPFLRNVTMVAPEVLIKTSGTYSFTTSASFGQAGRGYCTVRCDTGVTATLGRSSWDRSLITWRPGFQDCWLKGPRLKIDPTNWTTFEAGSSAQKHVFEGVVYESAIDFSQELDDGGHPRGSQNHHPAAHFMMDGDLASTANGSSVLYLCRNNIRRGLNGDLNNQVQAMKGELVYGLTAMNFRDNTPAFTVTSSHAAPSVQKTGTNGQNSGTLLLKESGVTVLTIQLANRTISQIRDDINTFGGNWNCTLDASVTPGDRVNDKCGAYLQTTSTQVAQGAFTTGTGIAAMAAGVPYAFRCFIDVHIDAFQPSGANISNWSAHDILVFDAVCQSTLIGFDGHQDFSFRNIAISSDSAAENQFFQWAANGSAFTHAGIVLQGYTDTGSSVLMGNSTMVSFGTHSAMNGLLIGDFTWSTPASANTANPTLRGGHIIAASSNYDTASNSPTNMTTGGTRATAFPYESIQNLTPDAAVVGAWDSATEEMPEYDAQGVERRTGAVKGPLVDGLPDNFDMTEAAAEDELAVVACSGETGSLGVLTFSYRTGAGETGGTSTYTVAVTAEAA
jgi:hypothetical protein